MYYRNRSPCGTLEGLVLSMSPVGAQNSASWADDDDDAVVYTMRDLNQRTASIMSQVEKTGKPAFITRHGRFVAMITPLAPGQVESYVLAEMASETGELTAIGPQPPSTETRRASGTPSPDPLIGAPEANGSSLRRQEPIFRR